MKKTAYIFTIMAGFMFLFSSCLKDLDTEPLDDRETTAADVFKDTNAYQQILAKIYAGFALTGQQGPAGMGDVAGIDEGFSSYLRTYFLHQVLSTDEAVIGWDDQTIKDFIYHAWTSTDVFVAAMYYRIFYQISLANEYIRQTSDDKLIERGVSAELRETIAGYRLEARFLRALSYYHAMDLFGNVPFTTDADGIGAFLPPQIQRADLFEFIEEELIEIMDDMAAPRSSGYYGRATRAAAWMVLAKIYLNAEVYTGVQRYTDCITYCNLIINAGYTLEPEYRHLFNADNYLVTSEIIFGVPFHGIQTTSYGGTNFIIHAQTGGEMNNEASTLVGIAGGWGGLRTTKNIVNMFATNDPRRLFYTNGQNLEINDLGSFNDGYASIKFTNLKRDGTPGSSLQFVDTDFPMFRLADVYLMYAEAVLRGGTGGDMTNALAYVNSIRERAFKNTSGNISQGQLTLDFILDERARELFWEMHRRQDLIRFNKFAGNTGYLWPWKGNSREGLDTDAKYKLFPLPASDVAANPNLTQNTGF